jgi:hypothetical protein
MRLIMCMVRRGTEYVSVRKREARVIVERRRRRTR